MSIEKRPFGHTAAGEAVDAYVLTNASGSSVEIITLGGIITRLLVPDRDGNLGDVVTGYDSVASYETQSPYFGALIGRVGNRIAKGRFTLDGVDYVLAVNNGENHLHGGPQGYSSRVWNAEIEGETLKLTLSDPDGWEGYPGNVEVTVVYSLSDENVLRIEYFATTDKKTPINLTNHAYFNLKDGGATPIYGHIFQAEADRYLPIDETMIPTGVASVEGSPIDFRAAKPLGQDLDAMGGYDHCLILPNAPALEPEENGGYNHCLVIRGVPGVLRKAAGLYEPETGRRMETWTTQPGFQLYTGNFLGPEYVGKGGTVYDKHHALCIETQTFPDSANHPEWPGAFLSPEEQYHEVTEYRFGAK